MRRVLGAYLVVTMLGLAVLPMTGPTAAQQAVRGGTLTFATGADPDSLDPQNTQSNPGEQVNRMMHENLVRCSAKMQLEPALAESWLASKDGLTWTFKLRKGVKFDDGTPFDAKAVKYFFDRVRGDHVTMERNDGYWGGAPNLDRVVVKTVREDQARVLMLESGDADLIVNIPTEEIPRLRKDARFTIESSPTARALFIAINVKKKPFDDVRVRQALNYAVNRDAIVKELFQNNAQVVASHVSPLQNGYAQLAGYPYDPKKSKELLAQAGQPALKVKLWSPKGRFVKDYELAQAVQQDLAAVGVEATLSTMEWGAYLAATKTPAEQTPRELFLLGWSPSTGEARWGTFPILHSSQLAPKGDNRGFFVSRGLDEAIDKATLATTDQARLGALREAQQIAIKEAPYIFLISPNMIVGTSKKVRGVMNLPLELTYLTEKSWKEK